MIVLRSSPCRRLLGRLLLRSSCSRGLSSLLLLLLLGSALGGLLLLRLLRRTSGGLRSLLLLLLQALLVHGAALLLGLLLALAQLLVAASRLGRFLLTPLVKLPLPVLLQLVFNPATVFLGPLDPLLTGRWWWHDGRRWWRRQWLTRGAGRTNRRSRLPGLRRSRGQCRRLARRLGWRLAGGTGSHQTR